MAAVNNPLFPVFLKLESLEVLVVGGGNVALEKLMALLSNSPGARVSLVATIIHDDVKQLLLANSIKFEERPFQAGDLQNIRVALVAVNDPEQSRIIRDACLSKNILVNVADKPDLCDFYLGAVVTKGQLKIGISTNGASPTIAKRLKAMLNETLPDEIDELLSHMSRIRNTLKGNFAEKVKKLNSITASLATGEDKEEGGVNL